VILLLEIYTNIAINFHRIFVTFVAVAFPTAFYRNNDKDIGAVSLTTQRTQRKVLRCVLCVKTLRNARNATSCCVARIGLQCTKL